VVLDYEATTTIDIFEGPVFRMEPLPNGRVRAHFLPWHRQWSHSLTVATLFALLCCGWGWLAGCAAFLAFAAHVAADQLGFMGSNLLYPFTRHRTPGLQMCSSDNAFVNFALTWTACLVTFWNLSRCPVPTLPVTGLQLLLYAGALPLAGVWLVGRWLARREA